MLIYVLSILFCSFYFILSRIGPSPDTPSYIRAGVNLLNGNIDILRTPVYPLFLIAIRNLIPEVFFLKTVIAIQLIVFLFSIYAFYYISRFLISNSKIAFIVTILYACLPSFSSLSLFILTESFAVSGTIFYLYCIIKSYHSTSLKNFFISNLLLLALIMLRPVFMYLLPISIFFWIYVLYIKRTKFYLLHLIGPIIILCITLFYANSFKKVYGIFTLSCVSQLNQYIILSEANLIASNTISVFKNEILQYQLVSLEKRNLYDEYYKMSAKYGLVQLDGLISNSIRINFKEYIKLTAQRIYRIDTNSIFFGGSYIYNDLVNILKSHLIMAIGNFVQLYFLLILYFATMLYFWLSKHKTPVFSILIWMLVSANVFAAVAGACMEWTRLIAPSTPLILLMVGQGINLFTIRLKSNELILK